MLDQVSYQEQILLCLQPSFLGSHAHAPGKSINGWTVGSEFLLEFRGSVCPLSVTMAVENAGQPQDPLGATPVTSSVFPSFTLEYLLAVYLLCARPGLDGDDSESKHSTPATLEEQGGE